MFRERIRQTYPRLSPNKKKVADFLMESHRDVAFMTASRLARHLKVDVATVVRFAQDIGYAGYPALAREIQELVKNELKSAHEFAAGEVKAESPFVAIMLKERENVERALMNIPADTVQQAVTTLKAAQNIYIIAQGEVLDLARFFATRLQLQGLQAKALSGDTVAMALALDKLTAGDVVVGLSHSKCAVETAGAVRFAREREAKTVGLVSTHASPVAHVVELVIICPSKSMTAMPSLGSMASIMDAILQMLTLDRPEEAAERQAALERTYIELVEGQRESFVALEKEVAKSE
jgi:DNA-binding MurR/RpiR family transcriptional regulator